MFAFCCIALSFCHDCPPTWRERGSTILKSHRRALSGVSPADRHAAAASRVSLNSTQHLLCVMFIETTSPNWCMRALMS